VTESENIANRHVDEMTLLLYVERQLDRERAQEVSVHTQTCTQCLTLLRALDRESRLLTRAMLEQDEALPARLAEFHAQVKKKMQWIWGLVFGLAVLGIYALYTGYIEPWEQQFEQAGFGGSNLLNLLIFQGAFWKGWQSMFTLLEVLALIVMAGFGIFAVRKYLRRGSALAVMFSSLGLLAVIGTPATAAESRKGDMVEVKKDEVLKNDVFLTGHQIRVEGTVDGDVYAFGQQLEVPGHVTGDVICFVQTARINGQVDGNVRSFTNNTTITGSVGKNITAFNDWLTLERSGKVGRNLMVFSSSVTVDGAIERDLLTFAHNVTVAGTIEGALRVRAESLTLSSSAVVEGRAEYKGTKPAIVDPGAKLGSPLEFTKFDHRAESRRTASYYVWQLIWAAAYVLFGLVLFWLMPDFFRESVVSADRLGAPAGLGVLVGFGVPIAAVIACVTVVGLFVGLSTFFLWYASLYFAQVIIGALVGEWILGHTTEPWPFLGRMVLGFLILRGIMTIPYLGVWLKWVIVFWGVGAISLTLYRRFQPAMAPNIPSVPMGPVGTPLPPNTTVSGV
jgi:cytoskeletal protein CcmA (bactofilin family)